MATVGQMKRCTKSKLLNLQFIDVAIKYNFIFSKNFRGCQRLLEVVRGHPGMLEVIHGRPRSFEVVLGQPRSSEVILGRTRLSEVI